MFTQPPQDEYNKENDMHHSDIGFYEILSWLRCIRRRADHRLMSSSRRCTICTGRKWWFRPVRRPLGCRANCPPNDSKWPWRKTDSSFTKKNSNGRQTRRRRHHDENAERQQEEEKRRRKRKNEQIEYGRLHPSRWNPIVSKFLFVSVHCLFVTTEIEK